MEAQYLNSDPSEESCASSFWEGHIINNEEYTFFTNQWDASQEIDVSHWSKFERFAGRRSELIDECDPAAYMDFVYYLDSLSKAQLEQDPFIYMRWKEVSFTNQPSNMMKYITIAGFYYISFHRKTGHIQGFYYDPSSMPFQELRLVPVENADKRGFSSCSYEFQ